MAYDFIIQHVYTIAYYYLLVKIVETLNQDYLAVLRALIASLSLSPQTWMASARILPPVHIEDPQ